MKLFRFFSGEKPVTTRDFLLGIIVFGISGTVGVQTIAYRPTTEVTRVSAFGPKSIIRNSTPDGFAIWLMGSQLRGYNYVTLNGKPLESVVATDRSAMTAWIPWKEIDGLTTLNLRAVDPIEHRISEEFVVQVLSQ